MLKWTCETYKENLKIREKCWKKNWEFIKSLGSFKEYLHKIVKKI